MNDPSHQTDRELFAAVSSGNVEALAELAARHARGLFDFAVRGTLDEHQAAVVLDIVFRRVREPHTQVPSQIDFRTWLYSLCLVEILALANEMRTARISTDDERFYQRTTGVDLEIARWVWQAARGLRTRDYCVLDLTLRRGLTPEEVAEAASLTRSNLYASIGRARGAFEETFAAMLLFEYGRRACPVLEELVDGAPEGGLRPALRHQIIEHSDDCDACRRTLLALPAAADVYISLAGVSMPNALYRRILGDTSVPLFTTATEPEPQALPHLDGTAVSAAFAAGSAALEPDVPVPGTPGLWDEPGDDAPAASAAPPVSPEAVPPVPPEAVPTVPVEAPWPVPTEASTPIEEPVSAPETIVEPEKAAYLGIEEEPEEALEAEEEQDPAPVGAAVAVPSLLVSRESLTSPAEPKHTPEQVYEQQAPVRGRTRGRSGQPLMWTYALLGVAAAVAIYLGIAVADSLQSGGRDSGAVPLDTAPDTAPGVSAQREIDCGDMPLEVNHGESILVGFDENALDGYRIQTLSFAPVSDSAEFEDLEATLEDPFSIRFVAKEQDTAEPRTEEFELRIKWQRGEESASSACQLLVKIPGD